MSASVSSRSIPRTIALTVLALVALFGVARIVMDRVDPNPALAGGSGVLMVGDDTYSFTPTTCFISDGDFVAAGTGIHSSQQFWVSASSGNLQLTFGTKTELDQPADDQLWLVANDGITWWPSGQTVTAKASMTDRRLLEPVAVDSSLTVSCSEEA